MKAVELDIVTFLIKPILLLCQNLVPALRTVRLDDDEPATVV